MKEMFGTIIDHSDKPIFDDEFLTQEEAFDLFGWEDIEQLLNNNTNNFELIDKDRLKKKIPTIEEGWKGITQDNKFIHENIMDGHSFIHTYASYHNKKVTEIASTLEKITGYGTNCHVYGNNANDGGNSFDLHTDMTANLIVQTWGMSRWKVYVEAEEKPTRKESDEGLTCIMDEILKPGCALYIPPKRYHSCTPMSRRISLSFAMMPHYKPKYTQREWLTL